MIDIYTDGSCCGNGKELNRGGYGVVVVENNKVIKCFGVEEENTTNNRMEMKAILSALKLSREDYKNNTVIIKSDSAYCVNMFNEWIHSWACNG